jgi:hypothetical protein
MTVTVIASMALLGLAAPASMAVRGANANGEIQMLAQH